ncbi:MAG: T9SS type A sorting domain-containing protein [Candidatus Latescibacteria bacterium]|nr:T9SS type A sorting domain-containing protein [Candidatus Latescibacterota bacterium]
MKKLVLIALVACCVSAWVVSAANARKASNQPAFQLNKPTAMKAPASIEAGEAPARFTSAAANTTVLASYTWNTGASCITQGWTTQDLTQQTGDYVHVDNFAGLGGGSYGLLVPLAGAQSLWIGTRANGADQFLCGYATLPGYGNAWHQILGSDCFNLSGNATISYLASWDSEPGFDFTFVEYDPGCSGGWTQVGTINGGAGAYDGSSAAVAESFVLTPGEHTGSTRFRFRFLADTAWSDSDGLWDTDGAFIVDNLVVQDGTGTVSNQTFEAEAVGANVTVDGHWQSANLPGYGNYAGLLPGIAQLQEDPCARDISCLWTFFNGSTANYSCGGFPSVTATPFGNSLGQYMTNEVWSPLIAWTGSGSEATMQFAVYRDLPLDNLVVYVWAVRSIVGGCPQAWLSDNTWNYGDDLDWLQQVNPIGPYIDPAATHIQIAFGVQDLCGLFCGIVGSGACHSHAPMMDNLTVKRVEVDGPQWTINGWELLQDNFASDGTVTGTVRIDAAQDILASANPSILPGDTASATVIDPVAGIDTDPTFGGPAIYAYVCVLPQGQPGKSGNALSDDLTRWPVVGSVVGPDGNTWWKIRFDNARTQNNTTIVPDVYCVDFNDDLFTPGDEIKYFFEGVSVGGATSYFFGGFHAFDNFDASGAIVTTADINVAYANPMEVTCLPDKALDDPANDILYVDDGDGRAVQPFFDQAFAQMGILDNVDRYDVRAPSSVLGNGPGARVVDVLAQVTPYYKKIIWNSEELEDGTIGDGTGAPDKGDDMAFLFSFLNNSTLGPGVYISGDGIAQEWASSGSASATNLRSVYLNFNLVTSDHKDVGLGVNPMGIGVVGGAFAHASGPDTLITFGGCLGINKFDVLAPTGTAVSQMRYNGNPAYSAVISQTTPNASSATARVMMAGFSYDLIRDDRPGANGGIMDRVHHLYDVILFLQNTPDEPVGAGPIAHRNSLSQNYPNPFNPSTSIEFTVRDRTKVSLNVYDVSGKLVRALLNEERSAGEVHQVTWDGRNDAGQSVSSGVYFYRLVASDFTQTKKMVLLK